MAKDDQFHREHAFNEGRPDPAAEEPAPDATPAGGYESASEVAGRGANPDPTGVAAAAPSRPIVDRPGTVLPASNEARQDQWGGATPGAGTSSAPTSKSAGAASMRHIPAAQNADLSRPGAGKSPVDEVTRGQPSELGSLADPGLKPRRE